ncbi:hypothetical protein RUM43_003899 [Polyplax serrata]|uniref:Uncharacterized protein n=1 Tax=Polyplax serrata TaxID=468196 RepID=A0AAN8P367_POLSC
MAEEDPNKHKEITREELRRRMTRKTKQKTKGKEQMPGRCGNGNDMKTSNTCWRKERLRMLSSSRLSTNE